MERCGGGATSFAAAGVTASRYGRRRRTSSMAVHRASTSAATAGGCRPYHPDMWSCPLCEARDEEAAARQICAVCMCLCETCDNRCCQNCAELIYCDACGRSFCESCAFDGEQLDMCDSGCAQTFCDQCTTEHLKAASGWAEEFQAREGEDAVTPTSSRACWRRRAWKTATTRSRSACAKTECALTCAAVPSAEAEPEEQDSAAAAN
jgi:hypothetical protein